MALQPVPLPTPVSEGAQLDQIASSLLIKARGPEPDLAPQPEPTLDPEDHGHPAVVEAVDDLPPERGDPGEPLEVDDRIEERRPEPEIEDIELSENTLFSVKVDGKFQDVTLRELKRGYSGQSRILQGNEDIAQLKKQAQDFVTQAMAIRDQQAKALEQTLAQQVQAVEPEIDWDGLRQADEGEWLKQRELHRSRKEDVQRTMVERQRIGQQQAMQKKIQDDANDRRQAEIVRDAIPDIADPVKGPVLQRKLEEAAHKFGYPQDQLSDIKDARVFTMLYATILADEGRVGEVVEQVKRKRVKPRIRPGRAPSPASRTSRQDKRRERDRLRAVETGHVDDVAKTLIS